MIVPVRRGGHDLSALWMLKRKKVETLQLFIGVSCCGDTAGACVTTAG